MDELSYTMKDMVILGVFIRTWMVLGRDFGRKLQGTRLMLVAARTAFQLCMQGWFT